MNVCYSYLQNNVFQLSFEHHELINLKKKTLTEVKNNVISKV